MTTEERDINLATSIIAAFAPPKIAPKPGVYVVNLDEISECAQSALDELSRPAPMLEATRADLERILRIIAEAK